jgi:hypothetical protein
MGEAKRRGTFEDRKKSSKNTKSSQLRISFEHFDDYCQATIIVSEQHIVLKAKTKELLALSLMSFGNAYIDSVNQLISAIAPQVFESCTCGKCDTEHDDVSDEVSSIFGTDLVVLTDDLYFELIKMDEFKSMSKSDFDSLRSQGFFYNPVRKSFQTPPEFSGFFDE